MDSKIIVIGAPSETPVEMPEMAISKKISECLTHLLFLSLQLTDGDFYRREAAAIQSTVTRLQCTIPDILSPAHAAAFNGGVIEDFIDTLDRSDWEAYIPAYDGVHTPDYANRIYDEGLYRRFKKYLVDLESVEDLDEADLMLPGCIVEDLFASLLADYVAGKNYREIGL